jgi:hypothetical protein
MDIHVNTCFLLKFVLSMFNNFVILAGMVSRVLSKIAAFDNYRNGHLPRKGLVDFTSS